MVRLPEDKEVSPKLKVSKLLTEFKQGFGGVGEINTAACQRPERNKWAGGANFNLDKLTQCLHSYPQQLEAS